MTDHTSPISERLASTLADVRAMADPYCYGSNVPGYIPDDMTPNDEPMSLDTAKRGLIHDMLFAAEYAENEEVAENLTNAAEDVNLWSGPDSIEVDDGTTLGRIYWLQQADPEDVDDYRATYVLCVDTEIVRDVMLGVGGPTTFVRFIFSADGSAFTYGQQTESFGSADLKRVEFHYSWGANDVTSTTLDDSETADMVAAFGYLVGMEY